MAFPFQKRSGGKWYIRFRNAEGRWLKRATTAKTCSAAQKLADDLEAKAERQRLGLDPLPDLTGGGAWTTLVDWYGETYASVQPNFRRWTSTKDVHLVGKPLDSKRVADITPEFLEVWLQGKAREGYAAQTINGLRAAVSVIFTRAKEAGKWRGPNPTTEVRKRKVPRRAYDFLRPHEVAPVLETAVELYGPVVACAFALALYAGLRRGEVAGLRKGDVDLAAGTLRVCRSHSRDSVKGGVEVELPIHLELAPFIEAAMGASGSEFVCPQHVKTGEQMPEHYDLEGRLRRTMAEAGVGITGFIHHCRAWHCQVRVEAADNSPRPCPQHGLDHVHVASQVRPLGFHDLRRSHASLLAHAGVSTAVAQKLMRHSDPKLTERVYTVVDVETLRREVGRMSFARAVSPRVSPGRGQSARQVLTSGVEGAEEPNHAGHFRDVTPTGIEPVTCGLGIRLSE